MLKDPLTNAFARSSLRSRLREEIERSQRYNEPLSLLFMDIDHFKSINDAYGHSRGDDVLSEFSERILSEIRTPDILYRYGGDEFVLVLPNTSKEKAEIFAKRLYDRICSTPFKGDPPLSLMMSVGIASVDEEIDTEDKLLETADLRLYLAKREGRAKIVSENPEKEFELDLNGDTRLVERDMELEKVNKFLDEISDESRGVLSIVGSRGSGKIALLNEVTRSADRRGYLVINVKGSHAFRTRKLLTLKSAFKEFINDPIDDLSEYELLESLTDYLKEKSKNTIIFTVENLKELDWESIKFLKNILEHSDIPVVGIIYTMKEVGSQRSFFDVPFERKLELEPLTRRGLSVYLRHLLKQEVPSTFTNYLHRETGGLPGFIHSGLKFLIDREILQKDDEEVIFTGEYKDINLAEKLRFHKEIPPNNLPNYSTNFVGRNSEIIEIKELLEDNQLISITGFGGIGKSRLAVQIAYEILEYYIDGSFFVPLSSVSSEDQIVYAIADALDFKFSGSINPHLQLLNYLKEREILLILDNFEHLLEGVDMITDILRKAERVKIITTTRERLNLSEEFVYELRGMTIPENPDVVGFEGYSAIRLFLEEARRVNRNFILKDEDKVEILKICELVDGVPLGIELASSWIKMLTPSEILEEIENTVDFLTTQRRDIPRRHQSVRAVFEYSWKLFSTEEREVFSRLSIFRGGFTRESAKIVANASLSQLSAFVDKSLLNRAEDRRFNIHELLREYALEKLKEDENIQNITEELHSEYYGELLMSNLDNIKVFRGPETMNLINREYDNILKGWEWALENREYEILKKYLKVLPFYHEMRSMYESGLEFFEKAIDILNSDGIEIGIDKERDIIYAQLLQRKLWMKIYLGESEEIKEITEQALRIVENYDIKSEIALAYLNLGAFYKVKGDYEKAEKLYNKSLKLYEELDDRWSVAFCLNELGLNYKSKHDMNRAENIFKRCYLISSSIGDKIGMARVINNLGTIFDVRGKVLKAKEFYERALELRSETDEKWGVAVSNHNLGITARDMGEYDEAKERLRVSIEIREEIGTRTGIVRSLAQLGSVYYLEGDINRAEETYNDSLELSREIDYRYGTAISLKGLGKINNDKGEHKKALELLNESLSITTEIDKEGEKALVLMSLGEVMYNMGDINDAKEYFIKSLKTVQKIEIEPIKIMNILLNLSRVLIEEDPENSIKILSVIINHSKELKRININAKQLLREIKSGLSTEAFNASFERGKSLELETVISEILELSYER